MITQVIYIDVLITVNLFINYLLLLTTKKFLSLSWKIPRVIIAEILSGIFSLYILLPEVNFFISLIIKLFMAASIIFSVFGFKNIKFFLKTSLCFFFVNFIFSGIMLAMWFTFKPPGMEMSNGIVYFNISPLILVFSTLISYFVIEIINRMLGTKSVKDSFCTIKIDFGNKTEELKAKIDTGNLLKEPFSNLPVIIIRKSNALKIVPKNILELTDNYLNPKSNTYSLTGTFYSIRMVPFGTVLGEGVLPAFKPQKIITPTGIFKEAYVAVCPDNTLSEEIGALINPELIN